MRSRPGSVVDRRYDSTRLQFHYGPPRRCHLQSGRVSTALAARAAGRNSGSFERRRDEPRRHAARRQTSHAEAGACGRCGRFRDGSSGERMMQAYDAARFDPPAPLALVVVRSEQLDLVVHDVPMLLDTGADVSLLPRSHVAPLVSPDAKQYELEAIDGRKSVAPAVTAELKFLGRPFADSSC